MAVNRYDNPAQAQFINTYVPIPFEQLYRIGKEANDRLDDTLKNFGNAKKVWSEFQSQSMKDMDTWDKATMGAVRPLINAAANNPELLKDRAWQSQLQANIANVDTGLLGRLKQSAKNFELRKAAIQKLVQEGKYNKYWHDMDMTNWDSTTQGVFDDINVTPYQSINDLVDPYVNDLKPSDMGSNGVKDFYGVSKERVRSQVDANISEIMNTPVAQMHLQTMLKQGLTMDQAAQQLVGEVYRAAEEKAWQRGEYNPLYLAEYKASLAQKYAKQGSGKKDSQPNPDAYNQAYATADILQKQNLQQNPIFARFFERGNEIQSEIENVWIPALRSGQITQEQFDRQMEDYAKQVEGLPKTTEALASAAQEAFTNITGDIIPSKGVAKDRYVDYSKGASRLLDMFSTRADGVGENNWYATRANKQLDINYNGTQMQAYSMPSTKGLMLDNELANKIMKVSPSAMKLDVKDSNGMYRNFAEDLKNGRFGNVIFIPLNEHIPVSEQNGNAALYSRVRVLIPKESIESAGYDINSFKNMYNNKLGGDYANLKIKEGQKYKDYKEKYYEFVVNDMIPSYGSERVGFDQAYYKNYGGATNQNDNYSSSLDQSFSDKQSTVSELQNVLGY